MAHYQGNRSHPRGTSPSRETPLPTYSTIRTQARVHELKTDGPVFQALKDGIKTFEIRKDDRGFKVGDELWLRETLYIGEEMKAHHDGGFPGKMIDGKQLEYTDRMIAVTVKYILRGPVYGLADGWCIMSVERS